MLFDTLTLQGFPVSALTQLVGRQKPDAVITHQLSSRRLASGSNDR